MMRTSATQISVSSRDPRSFLPRVAIRRRPDLVPAYQLDAFRDDSTVTDVVTVGDRVLAAGEYDDASTDTWVGMWSGRTPAVEPSPGGDRPGAVRRSGRTQGRP